MIQYHRRRCEFCSRIWHMPGRMWSGMLAAAPVKIWAQIGAAMAFTLLMTGFGLVIWLGPWGRDRQEQQIDWLGYGMMLAAFLAVVAMVAMTGLGLSFKANRSGVEAVIDQDDNAVTATVTATVEKG